jgi:hypothetical protein
MVLYGHRSEFLPSLNGYWTLASMLARPILS